MANHNIIVFGGTGSGKSSLINMLAGVEVACTSSYPQGCTFQSLPYCVNINSTLFTLHDTAGLDNSEDGRVPHADAIIQLCSLMKKLRDGISLLLFVIKAPARLSVGTQSTWKFFTEISCRNKVPTVVVVTGLENEADIDAWWFTHQSRFTDHGISPTIHACITTIKGKLKNGRYVFQDEYDESRDKMQKIISAIHRYHPWRMESTEWLSQVDYALAQKWGMSREDAEYLARRLRSL